MSTGQINTLLDSNGEPFNCDESQAMNITGTLKRGNGTAIALSELATLKLWLYDENSAAILNSRSDVNILNANSATVDANGNYVIRLGSADAVIQASGLGSDQIENHIARLLWTWNDGTATRQDLSEWRFGVRKLAVLA